MTVHLSRPDITEKEIEAVCEVLRSPNLSLGPKLGEFEQAFIKYTGRKHAIAVNSGTSGMHLAMLALGIGPGDEVITTPFTFIATSNTVMMAGAKPVFADIDPVTMNLDHTKIEEKITDRTKAILPIEAFGNPAYFDKYLEIARKHNLLLIEDSCEALGSALNGKKAGAFGDISFYAFYPNKQITTGEGGIIITDNDQWADMCFSLRNQGRGVGGGWLSHPRLGYNFRLSDINCALGIVQLSRLDEFKAKRKEVAAYYQQLLADEDRLIVPTVGKGIDMSWFVFVVRVKNITLEKRNQVLKDMHAEGIQVSNYFAPVHLQPFMVEKFGYKVGDFPVTDATCSCTIALPFHNNLSKGDAELVCETLKKVLDKNQV